MTNIQLNKRFQKIFDGKKISVNILRHSFLSEKYKGYDLKSMIETAHDMGHSVGQALEYIKK
jgi:hypothetical protein